MNNFYCYLFNYNKIFFSLSLGQVGFIGPLKNTQDAYEVLGYNFSLRLFNMYLFLLKKSIIMKINLIISIKLYKKIKQFLRKFLQTGLNISYVFICYKFAHNGCRKKSKKRL